MTQTNLEGVKTETAVAPPRDPEIAEGPREWCMLYREKYGEKPSTRQIIDMLDRHGWSFPGRDAMVKRALKSRSKEKCDK